MTLNAMRPDIIVVRHHQAGAVHLLARKVDCSVVNAGDGAHEHPTQALLDALTIRRNHGPHRGADSRHLRRHRCIRASRARTSCCSAKLGARRARRRPLDAAAGRHRAYGRRGLPRHALAGSKDADIVMMLRLQRERMTGAFVPSTKEYFHFFGLDGEKLAWAKPDALVMHPGPMNRGVEIDSLVADGAQSLIREQVEMGVAVRMAVLEALARNLPNG